jgi:hypothetical protein
VTVSYIIKRKDNERFWDGHGWVSEYPDALVMKSEHQARRELRDAATCCSGDAVIIAHYGYANESELRDA